MTAVTAATEPLPVLASTAAAAFVKHPPGPGHGMACQRIAAAALPLASGVDGRSNRRSGRNPAVDVRHEVSRHAIVHRPGGGEDATRSRLEKGASETQHALACPDWGRRRGARMGQRPEGAIGSRGPQDYFATR